MSCLDSTPFSAQVTEYILNSMPPETLVGHFRTALQPALGHTPEEFTAFLYALRGLGLERAVKQGEAVVQQDNDNPGKRGERHCVRCHKQYRESDNGFNACTITYNAFSFGNPTRNTSRHTTDIRQAMKTKGDAPVKTCQELWCGRNAFGADCVAVAPVFPQVVAPGTVSRATAATTTNNPLALSSLGKASNKPSAPSNPPAAATGAPNQAAIPKDMKLNALNGVNPLPQTAVKAETIVPS